MEAENGQNFIDMEISRDHVPTNLYNLSLEITDSNTPVTQVSLLVNYVIISTLQEDPTHPGRWILPHNNFSTQQTALFPFLVPHMRFKLHIVFADSDPKATLTFRHDQFDMDSYDKDKMKRLKGLTIPFIDNRQEFNMLLYHDGIVDLFTYF